MGFCLDLAIKRVWGFGDVMAKWLFAIERVHYVRCAGIWRWLSGT